MSRFNVMVIGLAMTACQCEHAPVATHAPVRPQEPPPAPQPIAEHMTEHGKTAMSLQAAVVHGRLIDARAHAAWFATHEMNIPSWQGRTDDLRDAATHIANAQDLPAAAAQLGRLGRACAACHDAENAIPAFPAIPPPATDLESLEGQMQQHQWAAARLWEGLIGPADERWAQGTQAMATARLDVRKLAHEKPNAEIIELAEQLKARASAAASLVDQDERAAAYGQMLTTCAGCHGTLRSRTVRAGSND